MGEPGIEEINGFLARVEQRFSPERIILFGSTVLGGHLRDSDYDIIVVNEAVKIGIEVGGGHGKHMITGRYSDRFSRATTKSP
jgi:predicted nucleotidyltransferase